MSAALIDTHIHVWDPSLLRYPWLDAIPALNRPVLPGVAGADALAVFVQADCVDEQGLREVEWVKELNWPVLRAVVAYAPVHEGDAATGWLETLGADPLVRGVRRLLQGVPEGFISSPAVLAGLRRTAAAQLAFDATVDAWLLAELAQAHAAVPELTLVLDHLGNPPLKAGLDSGDGRAWRAGVRAVARQPAAVLKLSGQATRTQAGESFVAAALEAFGPDRAMLGSDSPLSVPDDAVSYRGWAETAGAGLGLDAEELAQLRHRTAERVYRLAG